MWLIVIFLICWFIVGVLSVLYRVNHDRRDRWYDYILMAPVMALLKMLNLMRRAK
jgi:hypothetical protein